MAKEKKSLTLEDKKDLAKTGIISGAIMTGTGAAVHATGKKVEKDLAKGVSNRFTRAAEKAVEKFGKESAEKMVKNWKSQGRNVAVVGAPVLAVSAYKHYKYKKKKDDDSTEK